MENEVSISYYKNALVIDKHNLDDAFIEQPVLYQQVAEEFAYAVSRRDLARRVMKETYAGLVISIKKHATEKLTELIVGAKAEKHTSYKEAGRDYIDACKEADTWDSVKMAFEQRSYALKDLAGLFEAGYFSTSASSSSSPEAAGPSNDQRRAGINKKRKRVRSNG